MRIDNAEKDWADGEITEAGVASMRAQLGKRYPMPNWLREVSKDSIRHFALGLGDDNPLWWDEDYAKSSPHGELVAPPCYLYNNIRAPRLRPEQGMSSVEVFLPGVLGILAGETWRWNRPVRCGEKIHAEGNLLDVKENVGSFGGRSITQFERHYMLTDSGEVVAELDHVIKRYERSATRAYGRYMNRPLARYTEDDRKRFVHQYESERGARRGATPRAVAEVKVGDALGPMLKGPLTLTNIVAFVLGAGSSFNPTNRMLRPFEKLHSGAMMVHPHNGTLDTVEAAHWDAAFAHAGGLPAPYDLGIARTSWLSHLVTDWMGDSGFLVSLESRMIRPNLLGDVTWLTGKIGSVDHGLSTVLLELESRNQLDEVTATATAIVRLPKNAGQATKQ